MGKNREPSVFYGELCRDFATFKGLHGKSRLQFIWDYYRWKIVGAAFLIFTVCLFAHMLAEGQKPCRLRVCAVLNTDENILPWFEDFADTLKADGKPGSVELNQDQPFDYDNRYYYLYEIEVMTTISSQRMDVAVCNEDMYSYLLALNACMPLDETLSDDLAASLADSGKLIYDTANLTMDEDGNINPEDGIDGYFAVDLSGTGFYDMYNQTESGTEPLYAVIITNTEHLEDSKSFLLALLES